MKKLFLIVMAVLAMTQLTGCFGKVETGQIGMRTNWDGFIDQKLVEQGLYSAVTSHVDVYSLREIAINLENLTPKAHDNLSLQDLDVTVYYKVKTPQAVRDLALKRSSVSTQPAGGGAYQPSFLFVESVAKSEIADAISKHDSLTIHTKFDALAGEIKGGIQSALDKSDPGSLEITNVVIRQVKTDPTIEDSIRRVVAKEKELEAAKLGVAVAEENAKATQKTALTLTPAFLQHEYNEVLKEFAKKGGTVILDSSSSSKILNLK